MALLGTGTVRADSPKDVARKVAAAKIAADEWRSSSFAQRRLFLRILHKHILAHQHDICRVSARDSGKTQLEAVMGEIIVTCEKLRWLCTKEAEQALKPERRSAGRMAFYKSARVEHIPHGVVAAIVPWNWPFHNLINPVSAATFAGNAIVIKVSEHSAWSARYYGAIVEGALRAAGAPEGLVQIVVGHGDAGQALVADPGVGKVVFVGSTEVGRRVMAAASHRLTPVTLELGGKDAFVVGPGADLKEVVPVAIKAAFLNCGQNCASGERFLVHESLYDEFCARAAACARAMRQGAGGQGVGAGEEGGGDASALPPALDCGAMCMPGAVDKVQRLVDDAVKRGATLLSGGKPGANNPSDDEGAAAANGKAAAANGRSTRARASTTTTPTTGQFYPPTVLTGVTRDMLIWREEVFGPVMMVVPWRDEDEAVALANDCEFGLGSSVFCGSTTAARRIAARLDAGMSSVNDFNATYMCQSLPFGGVKQSGFGRFGGVEGLRALTIPKAVAEDRWPLLMRTTIPAPWLHPVGANAAPFARGLTAMFYGQSLGVQVRGLGTLLWALACLPGGTGAALASAPVAASAGGRGKNKRA
jgi:acyl-CoA reductase-like NAD-dependent aldehyde dehydrogenase